MKYCLLIMFLVVELFSQSEKVTLQLSWKNQFQFAGFYVAKEKGFYSEAGLDVNIKEFDHSVSIVDDVVSQKATYGVGRSSLLIDKNKGKPIVVISAIYQNSPSVLITTNPKIKTPADLLNKRVMITPGETNSASITSMLMSNGIRKDDIIAQKHSFDYKDLIKGNTDAMACYISNEPFYLEQSNTLYKIFNPKDYGYDFYGDILFTSQKEIKEHPQRVKKFHKASREGWLWAFENIESTAKLIYEKYNTQNKSLESLIYEGYILKDLALVDDIPFGHISKEKFTEIARVYQLGGLLDGDNLPDDFFDPFKLNHHQVKIGVLAKRGDETTHRRWDNLSNYLNEKLDLYNFKIIPLDFNELEESVKKQEIDFLITNTMYYVQLENKYGVSRIATLLNCNRDKNYNLSKFGGVIFTRSDNRKINSLSDLIGAKFGAVSPLSFGGWVMAYESLFDNNIDKDDLDLEFLDTHDAVVNAVLSGDVDAGTVRTDTLEHMLEEGLINLEDIKIINEQKYDKFPYLVSTKLYPEWPIAKLVHITDNLANSVLSELVAVKIPESVKHTHAVDHWTAPLDYSSVHIVLKKLKIDPYSNVEISVMQIVEQYALYIYSVSLLLVFLIVRYIYIQRINNHLNEYNLKLDKEVKEKTNELSEANEQLKVLANTDSLTGISNRSYFMKFAKKYFDISKRNNEELQILSLDLDYFKNINDNYGHQAGDDVLIEFTKAVSSLLRKSDIFGRIGGEEFCILLQNTSVEGATLFAQRVCKTVEDMRVQTGDKLLHITVSIGVATLTDEECIEDLIEKSDKALYKAKQNGRNQVKVYSQI